MNVVTTTVTAGALVRRPVRRLLNEIASEGVSYVEDKGFVDSQFVITGPRNVVAAVQRHLFNLLG